jgi:hypothetical protein
MWFSAEVEKGDFPGVFEIPEFCFAEYISVPFKYFLTNYVLIINPAFVFTGGVMIS